MQYALQAVLQCWTPSLNGPCICSQITVKLLYSLSPPSRIMLYNIMELIEVALLLDETLKNYKYSTGGMQPVI